jgi:hypothetical protein
MLKYPVCEGKGPSPNRRVLATTVLKCISEEVEVVSSSRRRRRTRSRRRGRRRRR